MTEQYEQRARKIVDDALKRDPGFEIDREQAVKEIAAALPKVDGWVYRPSLLTRILGSLFGLIVFLQFWCFAFWWWRNGRATAFGIEAPSKLRGTTRYPWSEISAMRLVGHGPITCPELRLTNGKTVLLQLADWKELASAARIHGIPAADE